MKNKTILSTILFGLSLLCSSHTQAANAEVENPGKKKETLVLKESKKMDDAIRNELDALLEEMSTTKNVSEEVSDLVLSAAFDFEGVRYRFGGTTRSGMDCSGLVMNAFNDTSINLPRNSSAMAQVGDKVSKNEAQKGDLIFFRTGRGSRISHVGIITEVIDDEIKFIHSSTTKGVIVSSTKEDYYKRRFVQINRVLAEQDI
ncbi:C40 family peptidase [Myroides sp. 1354]|uniref:C40 family peptidase n=1 Tax=unclassified Myroides TaxID=2642485 RepID=UPI002574C8AD|nr:MULTISPECIES: C40 family peptidase [unclassified Myroides]MDM1043304.1 C40 family peptidase [Myroides sp. R163-1]MDM1054643.1 C40 family peptidase [Myroides sp. 1354]MDM1067940.1 C40 family peptidase [Myroides sp. 1372]